MSRDRPRPESPPLELLGKFWLDKRKYEIKCSDFFLDWFDDGYNPGYETYSNKEVADIMPWELFDTKKECIEFHLKSVQEKIELLKSIEYKLLSQKY